MPTASRTRWSSRRLKGALIWVFRGYIRYVPVDAGKLAVFERFINPYLQWQPHRFSARTIFGSRIIGNTEDILPQYIYYFGVWEPNLTAWIQRGLRPGDTFVDVGANIGYFSLLGSRLVGRSGRVVAIEPSPRIVRQLRANIARNRVRNIRVAPVAASNTSGPLRLFEGPPEHVGATGMFATGEASKEFEVQAMTLPEILTEDEARSARIIKIDVEGAEALVVQGMVPLLSVGRADLEAVVEISPGRLAQLGQSTDEVLAVFARAGFNPYAIENDYSWESYVPPRRPKRPVRIDGPIEAHTDVIFSRQDAGYLR